MQTTYNDYIADVISGEITVCRWVRLAVERHLRDLENGHERGIWFDEKAAARAIGFFSFLKHWKGEWAGTPIKLEPAQQFWLASLFGWMREDGYRRFRTGYLEIGRKKHQNNHSSGDRLVLRLL